MERDRALTQDSLLLQPKQKQETGTQLRFSTEIIKKNSFRLSFIVEWNFYQNTGTNNWNSLLIT